MVKKKSFLLPIATGNEIFSDPTLSQRYDITIDPTSAVVHTDKLLMTRCMLCEMPADKSDDFFAEMMLRVVSIGITYGDGVESKVNLELIYGRKADTDTIPLSTDLDDKGDPFLERHPLVVKAIGEMVSHFMECTGLSVHVHVTNDVVYEPPPKTLDEDIHIVVGASPRGETNIVEVQTLCGIQLHAEHRCYYINGPTLGRGCVIADEDGVDNLQIVGNVIYLFTPRINAETEHIFIGNSTGLFAKQLCLASAALAKGYEPPVARIIETVDEFGELSGTRLAVELEACNTKIADAAASAADALGTYREALREKRAYTHILRGLQSESTEIRERLASAFLELRKMPLTHRIITTGDDAIHVETKRIIGRVGDKRYDYGSFIIRWSPGGKISIWPLVTTHPEGVPHPHIGLAGNICFGNVGPVIEQSFQEMQPREGFETLFDWLVDGYDENLAEHKASEWPEVTEVAI